jgi:hypothetical protein
VAWSVNICASTDGNANGQRIERLYQANGINVRMFRRQSRQPASSWLTVLCCEDQGVLATQVGCQFP